MTSNRLLLSKAEAGKLLGLGPDAVARLIRDGRLRTITVGKRKLIPRSELEAWIARELGHKPETA
jgi:excisionase family DNA binding protein